jgi:hypothetical protein
MPSILIKSAQAQNPFMEKAPNDDELVPIGPQDGQQGTHGPAPSPEQVQWADDDSEDAMDVAPTSPNAFKPITDENFLPVTPGKQPEVNPEESFDELKGEPSPLDEANKNLSVREKIWYSLNNPGTPLRIVYTSLAGYTTERTVEPDYVYWAGTRRHVLVAWCRMRNDWRAFIVDRITKAKLEGDGNEQEPID